MPGAIALPLSARHCVGLVKDGGGVDDKKDADFAHLT